MKKLITAADVQRMYEVGEKVVYADKNTIITAAAVDFMKEHGMIQSDKEPSAATPKACAVESVSVMKEGMKQIPAGDLMSAIKTILSDRINQADKKDGRFQVINTRDTEFNAYETGVTGNNVQYTELIGDDQSAHIRQGIVKIIASTFPRRSERTETGMVLEGSVKVTINGIAHVAKVGDMIFIPSKSDVILAADEYAKILYTTYLG